MSSNHHKQATNFGRARTPATQRSSDAHRKNTFLGSPLSFRRSPLEVRLPILLLTCSANLFQASLHWTILLTLLFSSLLKPRTPLPGVLQLAAGFLSFLRPQDLYPSLSSHLWRTDCSAPQSHSLSETFPEASLPLVLGGSGRNSIPLPTCVLARCAPLARRMNGSQRAATVVSDSLSNLTTLACPLAVGFGHYRKRYCVEKEQAQFYQSQHDQLSLLISSKP